MARKNKKIIISLFIVFLLIFVLNIYIASKKLLQSVEYDVQFEVTDFGIGFDVNTTALTFGFLNAGGSAERQIYVKNEYNFPIRVETELTDNLAQVISTNSPIFIEDGADSFVTIRLSVPEDFPEGDYSGKLRINIYKAKEQ